MNENVPAGITAIYVYDGRVLAHASDFHRGAPGGFTQAEAQTHRAKSRLAVEVVRALSSPALYENLDAYDCERLMQKMKGKVHVLSIGQSPAGEES